MVNQKKRIYSLAQTVGFGYFSATSKSVRWPCYAIIRNMRMRACLLGRPQVLDVGGTQETQQEINPTPRDRPPPSPNPSPCHRSGLGWWRLPAMQ